MSKPMYCDYIILGAGPGGLQLGYYLQKAGRDYLILEGGRSAGTFFKRFPRHRKLISINKVYTGYDDPEINLRWDWNSLLCDDEKFLFKKYSGRYFPKASDLVQYLNDFTRRFRIRVRTGVRVVRITKDGDGLFRLRDRTGKDYTCRCLVVATGRPKSYLPPIPGIELAEEYATVSVKPREFKNQRVLIIGKGNSGFETAENLVETAAVIHLASPTPLKMAWQSHYVGHLRAVNNNILDTYQLKSQNAVLDASIEKIERKKETFEVTVAYAHARGEKEVLKYDHVIACTGFRFDDAIFEESCRPERTPCGRLPLMTSAWESTNVKDMYFAGTLMHMRDYKKSTSGFIHGFRYNIRALHRIFEMKYHETPWPVRRVRPVPSTLAAAVLARINRTSALWQQFGFLCDLVVVPEDGTEARHIEEVPVDLVRESDFGRHAHYYTVTLEYGPEHHGDPFMVERVERNDADNAGESKFLHPVVRRWSGPEMVSEHHVIEDLAAEWREEVHIRPLVKFFELQFAPPVRESVRV